MKELVSPEQAETLVTVVAFLLALVCAMGGYRAAGLRGLVAMLCGPLLYGMWQWHKYLTRFDPATGYLGLDKVKVLGWEIVIFVVVGTLLGRAWRVLIGNSK